MEINLLRRLELALHGGPDRSDFVSESVSNQRSFTHKKAGGASARSDCSRLLRKTTEEEREGSDAAIATELDGIKTTE